MNEENLVRQIDMKKRYLLKAIEEYEYSYAPEYDKTHPTLVAVSEGTLDFDYHDPESDVKISPDGAWVNARVWVPKKWLES
jgi:hypothetical protein